MIKHKHLTIDDNIETLSFKRYINFYSYFQLHKTIGLDKYNDVDSIFQNILSLVSIKDKGLDTNKLIDEISNSRLSVLRYITGAIEYSHKALDCLITQKNNENYNPNFSDTDYYDENITDFEASKLIYQINDKLQEQLLKKFPKFFNDDFKAQYARYELDSILKIDFTKKKWHEDYFLAELQRSILLINNTDSINPYEGTKEFFRDVFVDSQINIAMQLEWNEKDMNNYSISYFFRKLEYQIDKIQKENNKNERK